MRRFDDLLAGMPAWLSTPFSVAAMTAALAGSGLMLLAASYGDFTPALWSGVAFVAAALFWQLADRTRHHG